MKKLLAIFSVVAFVFSLNAAPQPAQANSHLHSLNDVEAGDLIRGETFSAVYYMGQDGFRYVFPNSKTFDTWYDNFDNVKWISDADLGTIQIGGNVTYKPGVKMIKINSDPKTYAIDEGGTLRWVTSQEVAVSLYGSDWNTMIEDVPDAFFSNYQKGDSIEDMTDFNPEAVAAAAQNINNDKDLKAPVVVQIEDNTYTPQTITTSPDRPVKFVNNGNALHTATGNNLMWGSGTIQPGGSFIRYFDETGSFDYKCSYHPDQMSGTVTVE